MGEEGFEHAVKAAMMAVSWEKASTRMREARRTSPPMRSAMWRKGVTWDWMTNVL